MKIICPPLRWGPRIMERTEQLDGDEEGIVYAKEGAVDFEEITSNTNVPRVSDNTFCGVDATTITSAVLREGVDNVVSLSQ